MTKELPWDLVDNGKTKGKSLANLKKSRYYDDRYGMKRIIIHVALQGSKHNPSADAERSCELGYDMIGSRQQAKE